VIKSRSVEGPAKIFANVFMFLGRNFSFKFPDATDEFAPKHPPCEMMLLLARRCFYWREGAGRCHAQHLAPRFILLKRSPKILG
jgi:hypothetical protein